MNERASKSNNRIFGLVLAARNSHLYSDRVFGFACATAQRMERAMDSALASYREILKIHTNIYVYTSGVH